LIALKQMFSLKKIVSYKLDLVKLIVVVRSFRDFEPASCCLGGDSLKLTLLFFSFLGRGKPYRVPPLNFGTPNVAY